MSCDKCVKEKDKPLTYTKCEKCGGYRLLTPSEKTKIESRKRP